AENKISAAKNEVIGAISETMDLYGVTPSAGTLYATLYLSDQMNLDEMREELNMSKPSMSTSVRKLHNNGMVKKVYQQGSRKHKSEEHTSELQSRFDLVCRLLLEKKNNNIKN